MIGKALLRLILVSLLVMTIADALRYLNQLQDVDFVIKGGGAYKQNGAPVEENLQEP